MKDKGAFNSTRGGHKGVKYRDILADNILLLAV